MKPIIRFPDRFCADARPYLFLFGCFILSNILLVYTLYTRQPERYRSIANLLSFGSSQDSCEPDVQLAGLQRQTSGGGASLPGGGPYYQPGRTMKFRGMTLGNAADIRTPILTSRGAGYGVAILAIDKRSIPYMGGLRRGDVIISVNRTRTYSLFDFASVVNKQDRTRGILLDVDRKGQRYYTTVETRG